MFPARDTGSSTRSERRGTTNDRSLGRSLRNSMADDDGCCCTRANNENGIYSMVL